ARWQAELAERAGGASTADVGAAGPALEALAAAAVTVVAGECDGALAGPRIHVRGGTEETWDAFVAAAEEAGLDVVPLEQPADTEVRLLVQGSEASAPADVAIALDAPTLLAGSPAPALLAGYGRTPEIMTALARVPAGEASAAPPPPAARGGPPDSAGRRRPRRPAGGGPHPPPEPSHPRPFSEASVTTRSPRKPPVAVPPPVASSVSAMPAA